MRSLIGRLLILGVLLAPAPAFAIGGLYMGLGIGYGKYGGSELIMEEQPAGNDLPLMGEGCCAKGGMALSLRLGYSFFGIAAEFGIIANGWDLGSDTGGGGVVGGGIRAFPLDLLALGGLESDLPIDLSLGLLFGYTVIGKSFAYSGFGIDVDVQVDYKVTSFLSVGVKLDVGIPQLSNFVFTDYNNNVGRCLDDAGQQVLTGGDGFGRQNKDDASCNGRGPNTTFLAPQVVATLHFDVLE
jgi:hypothetical protein